MAQSTGALGATACQANALGQRIRKTNTTKDRVHLCGTRGRLIAEADPAGTLSRQYMHLNDIVSFVLIHHERCDSGKFHDEGSSEMGR